MGKKTPSWQQSENTLNKHTHTHTTDRECKAEATVHNNVQYVELYTLNFACNGLVFLHRQDNK